MTEIICSSCKIAFEVTDADIIFYKKMGVPLPMLCPEDRARRRLSFRNERKLYQRKCDFSGKEIISVYSSDKPFKVYAQDVWWSDKWDPLSYGRDFDFSRGFFEQWYELFLEIPKVALISRNSENCDYTNICASNKNCYLLVESSNNEDCHYGYWMQESRDSIDCAFCSGCELCYEVLDSQNCYDLRYSENCKNCRESLFLKDCIGCKNCFGCINLQQKQYCIFNQQYTKEDYEDKLKDLRVDSFSSLQKVSGEVRKFYLQSPHKYTVINNSEDSTGCYISNARRCHDCYHVNDAEDCKYAVNVWRNSKDNMDVDTVGLGAELNYECINTAIDAFHNIGCMRCWTCSESFYSDNCDYSQNLLGCSGLRKKQYCILNKQYTKEEYEVLSKKILTHMENTKELGEFFPQKYSPFAYNETVALEYYPLTKEEVLSQSWKWKDEDYTSSYEGVKYEMPDSISEVKEDVTKAVHLCEVMKKPFKIIPQEFSFYKKMGIPLPRRCPDQRHKDRMSLRNLRKLWDRKCAKCSEGIKTSYAPERPEIVYCETCYLASIY